MFCCVRLMSRNSLFLDYPPLHLPSTVKKLNNQMAATSLYGHTFPFLDDFSVSQSPQPRENAEKFFYLCLCCCLLELLLPTNSRVEDERSKINTLGLILGTDPIGGISLQLSPLALFGWSWDYQFWNSFLLCPGMWADEGWSPGLSQKGLLSLSRESSLRSYKL